MLDGLDEVPWRRLGHAYGAATDVPAQIRMLLSDDIDDRRAGLWQLGGSIVHQGSRYQATAYAVPFLLEVLAGPSPLSPVERARLIALLGEIAIGDESFYPTDEFPLAEIRRDAVGGEALLAAFEADETLDGADFEDHLFALDDADQNRLGAFLLLRAYEAVAAGRPLLERLRDTDPDPGVRAAAAGTLAWF